MDEVKIEDLMPNDSGEGGKFGTIQRLSTNDIIRNVQGES